MSGLFERLGAWAARKEEQHTQQQATTADEAEQVIRAAHQTSQVGAVSEQHATTAHYQQQAQVRAARAQARAAWFAFCLRLQRAARNASSFGLLRRCARDTRARARVD